MYRVIHHLGGVVVALLARGVVRWRAAITPGYLALGRRYHDPDGNSRTRDIPSVNNKAACPDAPYCVVSLTTTMATAQSGSAADTASSTNKRWRIALACNACRVRKSRCDGRRPSCSSFFRRLSFVSFFMYGSRWGRKGCDWLVISMRHSATRVA